MDQIVERRDDWVNQRGEHIADLERACDRGGSEAQATL
jgi:hypothetical protein